MAGYSATPLAKKLGIDVGSRIYLSDAPKNYLTLVAPLPEGIRVVRKIDGETDIVHIFSTERAHLAAALRATLKRIKPEGTIWLSWPKKPSKVPPDIPKAPIRGWPCPMGLA